MRKIIAIVLVAVAALGLGFLIYRGVTERTNYNDYDLWSILDGDNVKGKRDAKVLIFEYADFQCPGCAKMWTKLGKVLEEFPDDVAIVYRNFLMSYHVNGQAAASAAEAAARQGYWVEYADYLFNNQATWENISASEREETFASYFAMLTNGDVAQFKADMKSTEVRDKIKFDMGAGRSVGVDSTPVLYINKEKVKFSGMSDDEFYSEMRKQIKALLATE